MSRSKKSRMTLQEFLEEYAKLFKNGWLAYYVTVPGREEKSIRLAPPQGGKEYRLPNYKKVGIFDPITAVCVVKTGELFEVVFPRNAARVLGLSRADGRSLIDEGDGLRCGEVRDRLIRLATFDTYLQRNLKKQS